MQSVWRLNRSKHENSLNERQSNIDDCSHSPGEREINEVNYIPIIISPDDFETRSNRWDWFPSLHSDTSSRMVRI